MAVHVGYQGASKCTGGPQTGARGFMAWFLAEYKKHGGVNSGIYNCRSVRGGRTTSLHGEGRAVDLGIRPLRAKYGDQLAEALRKNSKELGIQCIIWNKKIWSGSYPNAGWRKYSGVANHYDHLHVELTWSAARLSEKAMVDRLNKYVKNVGDIKVSTAPAKTTSTAYKTVKYGDLLRQGTQGPPVKEWQEKALKYTGTKVDSKFGPGTKADTIAWQKKHGLKADGVVGPATWSKYKSVTAKPAAPAPAKKVSKPFPLPKGHWYYLPSKNAKNHSGYYAKDRAGVSDIQRRLGIKVTGKYNQETVTHVRKAQAKAKIKVDGAVGKQTWDILF